MTETCYLSDTKPALRSRQRRREHEWDTGARPKRDKGLKETFVGTFQVPARIVDASDELGSQFVFRIYALSESCSASGVVHSYCRVPDSARYHDNMRAGLIHEALNVASVRRVVSAEGPVRKACYSRTPNSEPFQGFRCPLVFFQCLILSVSMMHFRPP